MERDLCCFNCGFILGADTYGTLSEHAVQRAGHQLAGIIEIRFRWRGTDLESSDLHVGVKLQEPSGWLSKDT